MKTTKATSYFKKVTAAQAAANSALESRVGKKRENLAWEFQAPEFSDLATLKPEHVEFFMARALETYGRDLIAQNAADWDYCPSAADLTLAAAYDYYNAEVSRKRTLTKETAAAFAAVYVKFAPAVLGISSDAAKAASAVICGWSSYTGKENIRAAMLARLEAFAVAAESAENAELMEALEPHLETLISLLKAFEKKEELVISADAL